MSIRVRPPETLTIPISRGDTITVKKHLTAGEQLEMFERMRRDKADGSVSVDGMKVGLSRITTYLLDWTFQDAGGKTMQIARQPLASVESVLRQLPPEDFAELVTVISAHDEAMAKEREAEKNDPATASASIPTSPSAA